MHTLVVLAVLVYAPPTGHGGKRLPEAAQALKRALRAGGAEVMDGAIELGRKEHARGWVPREKLAFFAKAGALVDDGRRALERVELDRAEALLGRAERIYEVELARPGVPSLMSAVVLARGVALFELKRGAEAARAFRRAVALDGAAQLTEATVRPDVARAFGEAIAPSKRSKLTIVSTPPARLWVDGRPAGEAPATLEVGAGEHLVSASAGGRLDTATIVEVGDGGAEVRLSLPVDPLDEALAGLKTRPTRGGVAALVETLGIDGAVAMAIGVDAGVLTLVGQRFRGTGCATAAHTSREAPDLDRAADSLVKWLDAAPEGCAPDALDRPDADGRLVLEAAPIAHPRPEPLASPPVPKAPRLKFYERPWLWAGALVVTSLVVGLSAGLAPHDTTYQANLEGPRFTK